MYAAVPTVRSTSQLSNTAAVLGTPTQWPASAFDAEAVKPKKFPSPAAFPSTYNLPSRSRLRWPVGPPALRVRV